MIESGKRTSEGDKCFFCETPNRFLMRQESLPMDEVKQSFLEIELFL